MGKKDEVYEVESIIGKRRKKNSEQVEYRVMWKGWPRQSATWEPEEHLSNVIEMVHEFNKKLEERNKSNTVAVKNSLAAKNSVDTSNKQSPAIKPNKKPERQVTSDEEIQREEIKPSPVQKTKKVEKAPLEEQPEKKSVQSVKVPQKNGGLNEVKNEQPDLKRTLNMVTKNAEEEPATEDDSDLEATLEVTGMFVENGKYEFTVVEKKLNRRVILKRKELLKRDPLALVKFYERHLNVISSD